VIRKVPDTFKAGHDVLHLPPFRRPADHQSRELSRAFHILEVVQMKFHEDRLTFLGYSGAF
jgi:hypothetical protein